MQKYKSIPIVYMHVRLTQNERGQPRRTRIVIKRLTYLITLQICPVPERLFRVLRHCHTVLQKIARDPLLTTCTKYKSQWYLGPIRSVDSKTTCL